MNRLQYRIVFNKQRGQLMAVAETVRAQTKAAGQTDGPSRRGLATTETVVPTACGPPSLIALAVALAAGAVLTLLPVPAAQAQSRSQAASPQQPWRKPPTRIVADPSAPANQQPTVLTAPNGTTLVNIQTPSAAGVSRNTYGQFDVGPDGAILNNSRTDTSTQLGGWVQGNPWLGRGEARVILNEVNSSAPSQLNGYVEVAGRRAEVIIANPAGIQVDGGGFINASSATLTTGTPRLDAAGNISGFAVQGGLIRIDGAGLDASSTDYTALLARAVELNAGFWAKEARIQTGTQVMSAETAGSGEGAGEGLAASGERPRYALDSTALGGIYAQRITLVGTEAGLGVRQAGQMVGGQLTLRADGWLDNTGTVYAQDSSADALTVRSATGVSNAGWMAAKGSVSVTAPRLQGDASSVTAAGLNEDGSLVTGTGALSLNAGDSLRQSGQVMAGDQIRLRAPLLDVSGASVQGGQLSLQGGELRAEAAQLAATGSLQMHADGALSAASARMLAGDLRLEATTLQLTAAELSASGRLSLQAQGLLNTSGASLIGQQLQVAATDINSRGGEWLHLGQERFTAQVTGQWLMDGGRLATNAQDLVLSAGSLSAGQAKLEHYGSGTFSMTAPVADLSGAAVTSYGSLVAVGDRLTLDNASVLARSVTLSGETLSLQHTELRSATTASLSGGTIDHRGALTTADQGARLSARQTLNNDGGQIHAASGSIELTAGGNVSNRGGVVSARDALTVAAGALDQANGALLSGQDVRLRLDGDYREAATGAASSVLASGSLSVTAADIEQTGVMRSGGSTSLEAAGHARFAGSVYAQGASQLRVTGDAAVSGLMGAQGDLSISAGSLQAASGSTLAAGLAENGQIQPSAVLSVRTPGDSQVHGELLAGHASLSASSLDLTAAQVSTTALQLQSDRQLTTDGAAVRSSQLALQAGDWSNRAGQVAVTGTQALQLQLTGQWDNRGGSFQTNSADARLSAGRIDNSGGLISTSGTGLQLQTPQFLNQGGLLAGAGSIQLSATDLANGTGQISGQSVSLQAQRLDNAADGLIAASTSLQWTADQFRNSGVVQAGQGLTGTTRGLLDNQGLIRGLAAVALQADQLAQNGTVAAQGDLSARARTVSGNGSWAAGLATDNTLSGPATLTLQAQDSLQASGQALASTRVAMEAGSLALQGSQMRAAEVALATTQGDLHLDGATVGASGTLRLSSAALLSTAQATLSGASVALSAADWSHIGGSLAQTDASGALIVSVAQQLNNTRGTIQANAASVLLQAQTFTNTQGHLLHAGAGSLRLDVGTLEGAGGELLTQADLSITSTGSVDLSQAKTQGRQVSITAETLQHQGGQLLASGAMTVSVQQSLDNTGGIVQSGADLTVSGGRVLNRDGQMTGQNVSITGAALRNDGQGLVHAQADLSVQVGDLSNAGALQATSAANLHSTGDLNNSGVLRAQGDLTVTADGAMTHTGGLTSQGNVQLTAASLSGSGTLAAGLKTDNTLAATGDLTVQTTGTLQQSGQALAAGRLSMSGASIAWLGGQLQGQQVSLSALAGDLRLDRSQVRGGDHLTMTAAQALHTEGAQLAAGKVSLTATDWHHAGGTLVQTANSGTFSIGLSGQLDNTDGQISSNAQDLQLTAGQITNTRGSVTHAGGGALTVSAGQWSGAQGQLLGAGTVSLSLTGEADLRGATTQGGQALSITGAALQHQSGRMLSGGALTVSVSGGLDNTSGQLAATTDAHLTAASLINQNGQITGQTVELGAGTLSNTGQGTVNAQGTLALRGGQVVNEGALQSGGAMTLDVTGALGNSGSVYTLSSATVNVGTALTNNGLMAAQGGFSAQAVSMLGQGTFAAGLKADNTLAPSGELHLQAQQSLQNAGALVAGGSLTASAATLQLQDSQLTGQQVSLLASQGDLRLDRSVLASSGALSLTALAGQLNTQAATLSGSSVDIAAQQWLHAQGVLTQTAPDGHLTATVATTLDNQGGQIQAVGSTLALTAQTLQNTQGRIVQAASAPLASTQLNVDTFAGAGGQLLTTGSLSLQATGAVDLNAAVTQANGLTLSAATLSHQAGRTVSTGAATLTVAGLLDNSGGGMAAAGPLMIRAGSLSNGVFGGSGGTVQGDGSLELHVDAALDNQGGRLRAGNALTVNAGSVDNRSGWAGADGALTVTSVGDLRNTGGSLLSGGALTLDASSIGNQQGGKIASLAAGATVRSQGQLDNSQGSIQAAQTTSISVAGLLNRQGEVSGASLGVDTRGQSLDNSGGWLLADRAITVDSGALENRGGLMQAGTDLTVRTHGQALTNTRDLSVSTTTGLHAQGALTVETGALVNETGMSAGSTAQITAGSLTNRGEIAAGGSLAASVADVFNNQGGRFIGAQTAQVSAAQILNQDGLIYGGQTLTVTSQGLIDNSGTASAGLGLQGGQVSVTAPQLDNRSGQVLANGELRLVIAQSLDNSGGQLGAVGRQTVGDGQAPTASALSLNNSSGRIWSGTDLGLGLRALTGGQAGQMSSGGALSLALQGDLVYGSGSQIQATGDTTLTVTGQFTNQGVLRSGGVLRIGAAGITNEASGELNGRLTLLNATGTLTNRGLIDGDGVSLTADRIVNLGTGRLYGTDIVLTGGQLVNDAEGGQAAVIAARNSLDAQFSRDVLNRAGAFIFADGGMQIQAASLVNENASIEASQWLAMNVTGAVENRTVYSGLSVGEGANGGTLASKAFISSGGDMQLTAGSLVNSGATIEARGNLLLSAADIRNLNPYLGWFGRYEEVTQGSIEIYYTNRYAGQGGDESITEIQLDGRTVDEAISQWQRDNAGLSIVHYNAPDSGASANVTQSAAGHIIVGGTLVVQGSKITNDMSVVVGRDGVAISGDQVNNINRQVQVKNPSTGALETVSLVLPGAVQSVFPNEAAPGVRAASDAVTPGSAAGAQQAQAAGSVNKNVASSMSGLSGKALSLIQTGAAASPVSEVSTAWRSGSSLALAAVTPGADAGDGLSAIAEQRQARSGMVASLRDASAAVVHASVEGQMASAPGATTVPVGDAAHAAEKPPAAEGLKLRGSELVFDGRPLARTVHVNLTLPGNSLFVTRTEPTSRYLVETDPRFANYRDWLSSDYLLQQLALDPATTQKRLGDGYYEQRLVREQIGQLTGSGYLSGYASDEEMYRALLSEGASFAKEHQLIPGVALTAEQMSLLTSDLVWLVEQEVTLADGSTQRVLVPQVYLMPREGDMDATGALIAGNRVEMALTGNFMNEGTVKGGDVVVQAQNVSNTGTMRGTSLALTAREDLTNVGGTLAATGDLSLVAGRNIDISSTTLTTVETRPNGVSRATVLDKVADLSAGGVMVLQAGQDVSLTAAQLRQGGEGGTAAGGVIVEAGRDLTLGTVEVSSYKEIIKNANNYKKESLTQDSGTVIDAQALVSLKAGQDLMATAAEIKSAEGAVSLSAGRDVQLLAGEANQVIEEMTQKKKSGFLKKKVTTTYSKTDETVAVATTVSGDTVSIQAGQDIGIRGSNVVSDAGTSLAAGRDVTIDGATNTLTSENFSKTVKSGLMGGGGIGVTIGKQSLEQTNKKTELTSAGSTVASVQGDVTVVAGADYKQVGSTVSAPAGDVSVTAQNIDIEEARNKSVQNSETKFKQTGVTLSISAPGVSAAMGAVSAAEHTTQTEDDRMKALAAATAISKAMQAQKEIAELAKALEANKGKESISVSISVGSSQSTSTQTNKADQAAGSSILAGGQLNLTATGAEKDSNVTVRGSSLAGQDVVIKADNAINLVAAGNSSEQHSDNQSTSASVGIGFSVGQENSWGITVSGSVSKGNSDGVDQSYTTTEVKGGSSVVLQSGGDTALKGAVVTAPKVTANVGGDLKIESLQDTATFDSKSMSASASVTFNLSGVSAASASYSQSKVSADYAAVGTQAGIRAGDGGFSVTVAGNTDLKGGAITSSQAAIDASKNVFTTGTLSSSDIANRSQYSASAVMVSVSTSGGMAGAFKDSADERSTTRSTISAADTSITSGDAGSQAALDKLDRGATNDATAGKLAQGWDGQELAQQAKLNAQIVAEFGAQAAKEVGDYAASKTKVYDLAKLQEGDLEKALTNPNLSPSDKQRLLAQLQSVKDTINAEQDTYDAWKEGGNARAALHALVGGLTGDWMGALGAGASSKAAPLLEDFQKAVKAELVAAGMDPKGLADGLSKLAAGLVAGASGSVLGSASGAAALNQDFNNRQLHVNEQRLISELSEKRAKEVCGTNPTCDPKIYGAYLTDAMQRLAEAAVDSDKAKETAKYFAELQAIAERNPNSVAALGGLEGYAAMLMEARALLAPYVGKIISVRGVAMAATGSVQTYFQATEAQRNDHFANTIGFQPTTSIVPGMNLRDEKRIEGFTAQLGSAVPDTTLEEFVFGGVLERRVGNALGEWWTTLGSKGVSADVIDADVLLNTKRLPIDLNGKKPIQLEAQPALGALPTPSPTAGSVIRNALEPAEFLQAQDLAAFRGGQFVGAPSERFPGIDGWLDGVPVQLKSLTGKGNMAILRNIRNGAADMAKANYAGELAIDATQTGVSIADFANFVKPGSPVSNILNEGTVKGIYIKLPDGWLHLTATKLKMPGK